MKKLQNVFYVLQPDVYLSKDGDNIVVSKDKKEIKRLPIHTIESIVCFNYQGVSPALMQLCGERNIGISFFTPNGRFQGRVLGSIQGNVLLRKQQYRYSDNETESAKIARNMILGKIFNSRVVLKRAVRDHSEKLNIYAIETGADILENSIEKIRNAEALNTIRGIEGTCAKAYFESLDHLILHQKENFYLIERNRRPPLDNMNALLSFLYSMLTNDIRAALESVGLDPYVGFLHRDRPGRVSLALDLMEELRPVMADRVALSLVNRKQVNSKGFITKESGGVLMKDETRMTVLKEWQEKKKEEITHPFLNEKIEWGLVPYVQALLLARYIRGDLEEYPPFLYK
ncbi:CRISPR-associated endonuclease Cas1 [Methanimicrococcus sp. At1]|uniref:CRISPR-associated endonuclease Cas1 n=1 Tax=Methanimicrococcus hacksteinii TaxID=3028293 RepID=A0ABU3VQW8_9EURY|nr:type I-C CRISPR-associated endonuclease Cas1c [Methanimicrococcus sp. At1]MDV0445551.1 CRISPR-associated endonuclease Cas1 [Methanimicrococcus sp. At1]